MISLANKQAELGTFGNVILKKKKEKKGVTFSADVIGSPAHSSGFREHFRSTHHQCVKSENTFHVTCFDTEMIMTTEISK